MVVSIRIVPNVARINPGEALVIENLNALPSAFSVVSGSLNLPRMNAAPTMAIIIPVTKPR